jgi:hypothetical protein
VEGRGVLAAERLDVDLGGGHTGKNPFAKDSFNLTEQGKLIQSDKTTAARLAQEAGVAVTWQ